MTGDDALRLRDYLVHMLQAVDEIESYMQQWNTIIHELPKLKTQLNDLQHLL